MYVLLVICVAVVSYLLWIKYIYYLQNLAKSRKQLLKCMLCRNKQFNSPQTSDLSRKVRALFLTAHPDDECMFFAPAILGLLELNASVHLLCLSQGNYYNQGVQRREELLDSCAVLGIPDSQVTIHDSKELPDNPNIEWSISVASSVILKHIRAHSINLVLTFDGTGVSGHSNHTAIYKAVSYLGSTGNVPDDCSLLSLSTISVLRKYLSFLELPISWLLPSDLCFIIESKGHYQAKRAMLCHRTQLLWFRYLYIWFSRYMFVNTFRVIDQGPKNLKVY
uniref:N-acetylglucosaminylphosphatidylinositol deacetylase n=1 Tax=Esox lucius TaxID=8010 RepID=A0A3P9AJQ1_ESOLU